MAEEDKVNVKRENEEEKKNNLSASRPGAMRERILKGDIYDDFWHQLSFGGE
jgi:hypothetical protein